MRRKLVLLVGMIVMISCFALSGCSKGEGSSDYSDSKYVGTWKIDTISFQEASEEFDENWVLIVKADGTGISKDSEEETDFTWQPTEDGFKTKGSVKMTFKDKGDKIETGLFGVNLTFHKEK